SVVVCGVGLATRRAGRGAADAVAVAGHRLAPPVFAGTGAPRGVVRGAAARRGTGVVRRTCRARAASGARGATDHVAQAAIAAPDRRRSRPGFFAPCRTSATTV